MCDKPDIKLPSEPSTVNYTTVAYEAQDEEDDSEYQILWSKMMEEGRYKNSSIYTNVEVLLLCWEKSCDDLAVSEEVLKLKATFETRFNYHAEIKYLDANIKQKLQVQINAIVASFICAHDSPSTLLIVYYAGHGRPGTFFGSLELHGQISKEDRWKHVDMLVWNKTEMLLKDAEADVLEIFDCCYAGNLSLTRGENRLFEYLGATTEMATTPIPGEDSFTSALIYALEALLEEKYMFTTVELLRKIMLHAPKFPKDQTPVLSDRKDDHGHQAGRIMLYPLRKNRTDGSPTLSMKENGGLDELKGRTLSLHFDFGGQPSYAEVETLGRELNQIFEMNTLGVNRVRWGGMKQSAAARAVGIFQAELQRSRRASMIQQQAASERSELWLGRKDSELVTPPSSLQDSPRALACKATESVSANPPDFSAILSSSPLRSNEESNDGQIPANKVRNKLRKYPVMSEQGSHGSYSGRSTPPRELSSTTSASVVDQWDESDQSKHEQQQGQPIAFREILGDAFSKNASFQKAPESSFVNVAYHCFWEVLHVLVNEYEPNQPLSRIVTLTGTLKNAQAATCGDYITQMWPNAGPFLLEVIGDALKMAQKTALRYDSPPRTPAQGFVAGCGEIQLSVGEPRDKFIVVRVQGSMSFQVEVAGVLAWLAAAIRISESTEVKLSRARLLFMHDFEDTGRFHFWIEPETLEDSQRKADFCWQPLFVNSVIAVQFPVRGRSKGVGVDISPTLMATLAGTVTAVEFCGGLILKGLSTALISVRRLGGEQAIQWHLEVTDSTEDIIQTKCLEASETEIGEFEMCRVETVDTFWENRAYLGWSGDVFILLGTKESDYSHVTGSDTVRNQQTVNLTSFSFGLAPTGGGIGGPIVAANFTIGRRNRPVFMDIKQTLEDRLRLSIKTPLLLYDTSTKRGWLVPQACVLLHMMHLRLRVLVNTLGPSEQESIAEMPFANITQEGGLEAYGILVKYLKTEEVSPLGSSEKWNETLAKFYVGFDMALNKSILAKEKALFASSSDLNGFDLLDVVRAESPFKFTQRKIQRESGGWTTAAETLGYALFCSGIGDAMIPGEGANVLCRNWQRVPRGSDYLCAYVPSVVEILARQGRNTSHLVANKFRQNYCKDCSHEERSRCSHLQTFDNILDPPRLLSRGGPAGVEASACGSSTLSGGYAGAAIFGKITKVTKAYPRKEPSDDGDERRHRP